jgi:hypothetical protein
MDEYTTILAGREGCDDDKAICWADGVCATVCDGVPECDLGLDEFICSFLTECPFETLSATTNPCYYPQCGVDDILPLECVENLVDHCDAHSTDSFCVDEADNIVAVEIAAENCGEYDAVCTLDPMGCANLCDDVDECSGLDSHEDLCGSSDEEASDAEEEDDEDECPFWIMDETNPCLNRLCIGEFGWVPTFCVDMMMDHCEEYGEEEPFCAMDLYMSIVDGRDGCGDDMAVCFFDGTCATVCDGNSECSYGEDELMCDYLLECPFDTFNTTTNPCFYPLCGVEDILPLECLDNLVDHCNAHPTDSFCADEAANIGIVEAFAPQCEGYDAICTYNTVGCAKLCDGVDECSALDESEAFCGSGDDEEEEETDTSYGGRDCPVLIGDEDTNPCFNIQCQGDMGIAPTFCLEMLDTHCTTYWDYEPWCQSEEWAALSVAYKECDTDAFVCLDDGACANICDGVSECGSGLDEYLCDALAECPFTVFSVSNPCFSPQCIATDVVIPIDCALLVQQHCTDNPDDQFCIDSATEIAQIALGVALCATTGGICIDEANPTDICVTLCDGIPECIEGEGFDELEDYCPFADYIPIPESDDGDDVFEVTDTLPEDADDCPDFPTIAHSDVECEEGGIQCTATCSTGTQESATGFCVVGDNGELEWTLSTELSCSEASVSAEIAFAGVSLAQLEANQDVLVQGVLNALNQAGIDAATAIEFAVHNIVIASITAEGDDIVVDFIITNIEGSVADYVVDEMTKAVEEGTVVEALVALDSDVFGAVEVEFTAEGAPESNVSDDTLSAGFLVAPSMVFVGILSLFTVFHN